MSEYDPLSSASELAKLGFNVFPVHSIESDGSCTCGRDHATDPKQVAKHPVTVTGVRQATNDPAQVRYYWDAERSVCNVGVATGAVSGIWVLDIDDPAAIVELESDYGPLPATVTVRTGSGGEHRYFKYPRDGKPLGNRTGLYGKIDVRGDGGYVIAPPSKHASGNRYSWIASPQECEFAEAPDWLLRLIRRETEPTTNPTREADTGVHTITDGEIERARRYLAEADPSISGSNGHGTAYRLVCRLVELLPSLRDDEDAFVDALADWNDRCVPPWSDAELRHKIRDACRNVTESDPASQSSGSIGSPHGMPSSSPSPSPVPSTPASDKADDEWPVLDPAAYHGFAGEFVKAIEPLTEADPVAILVQLLTTFGVATGRRPYAEISEESHHAKLSTVIVGQSSRARKGTSWAIVRSLFAGVLPDTRQHSGLSTGEGLIALVADDRPTDAQRGVDKRCLIVESEFARVLAVKGRQGNTLDAVVRDAWDDKTLQIATRTSPIVATGSHIGVIGHVTKPELQATLSGVDRVNGFANRFLWTLCRRSKTIPRPPKLASFGEFRERLKRIVTDAATIREIGWSDAGGRVYDAFCIARAVEPAEDEPWHEVTSRAEAQVLRLAMIYALLDQSETIEAEHVQAALAVWRYCEASARLIFGAIEKAESKTDRWRRKIAELVATEPGSTRNRLHKAVASNATAAEFDAVVRPLIDDGTIVREVDGRAERYYPAESQTAERPNNTPDEPPTVEPPTPTVNVAREAGTTIGESGDEFDESVCDAIEAETTPPKSWEDYGDLLAWKNATGARVYHRDDGVYWVAPADTLTPRLRDTIRAFQGELAAFVSSDERPDPPAANAERPEPPPSDESPPAADDDDDLFVIGEAERPEPPAAPSDDSAERPDPRASDVTTPTGRNPDEPMSADEFFTALKNLGIKA